LPKLINKILANEFADKIAWDKIDIFLEAKSLVSFRKGEANSNGSPLVEQLPVPKQNIHSISADLPPLESAAQYDILLHKYFTNPEVTFDLAIIGLSEDGNTFSFVPGSAEKDGIPAWVAPVYDAGEDVYRIMLTSKVINAAAIKAFVVTGKKRQEVVQEVLKGKYNPEKFPAQLIQSANKEVHWFMDEAAAGKLIKPTP
jgi:6-phosphogluconolactonase